MPQRPIAALPLDYSEETERAFFGLIRVIAICAIVLAALGFIQAPISVLAYYGSPQGRSVLANSAFQRWAFPISNCLSLVIYIAELIAGIACLQLKSYGRKALLLWAYMKLAYIGAALIVNVAWMLMAYAPQYRLAPAQTLWWLIYDAERSVNGVVFPAIVLALFHFDLAKRIFISRLSSQQI